MGTTDLAYTTRKVVAIVVNSDNVNDIVDRMKKALGGGSGAVVMIWLLTIWCIYSISPTSSTDLDVHNGA